MKLGEGKILVLNTESLLMLAKSYSAAISGVEALPVVVEVNTGEEGEMRLILVGLPDTAVRESQDRVTSALQESHFKTPFTRTTINLAPGTLRKEGPMYDLPIALTILAATQQIPRCSLDDFLIAGELGLSGETRPIRGALSIALLAKKQGRKGVLLPRESAMEAAIIPNIDIYAVDKLDQAAHFLSRTLDLKPLEKRIHNKPLKIPALDFSDVKGQYRVVRAIEVAIAGNHNILMIGPPGSGKSMIAKRIPTIMPAPNLEEKIEIQKIYSAAGLNYCLHSENRPFRAPHHTISDVGLLGGGSIPKPGEISLAHLGVLFLDELPEFRRSTLEVLRQPLEDSCVTISRSAATVTLPASFSLVAAMNPTPDGFAINKGVRSRSTPAQIQKYRARISQPLLDRIDIQVEVDSVSVQDLENQSGNVPSSVIRSRVELARERQKQRFSGMYYNASMSGKVLEQSVHYSDQQKNLLRQAINKMHLSARAYDRIRKVSLTIADLEGSDAIKDAHLLEAIQYRSLDRNDYI